MIRAERERRAKYKIGPKQQAILDADARFVDVEGALRSAKTWSCLIKIRRRLEDEPGVQGFMARWTQEGLNQKLIPDWRRVCALMGLSHGEWHAREECFDFPNGSRLYAIHLKSSQLDNRYGKVRGLTVAFGYIDQLEEVPEDVYDEAALRLSQPGYAQQLIVSPNPVPETHWIARRFPPANGIPQHQYLSLAIWDNAHNLDPQTIEAAEALYPVGHPLRRVKLEGRRGLDVKGKPVYMGAFVRSRHLAIDSLPVNPSLPLGEAYDFGFHHPCVIWYQWAPWGVLRILGGVLGHDLHLDAFLPIVQRYRDRWFPRRGLLQSCCDPAGAAENSQGLRGNPVTVLREWYRLHGDPAVQPEFQPDANHPEKRTAAIQIAVTYMRAVAFNGEEAFLVDPERWRMVMDGDERYDSFFVDGLEAGYVLEDEPRHSQKLGTYWVPKKDGFYEHPMNCFEYAVQCHVRELPMGTDQQPAAHQRYLVDTTLKQAIEARRQLRAEQRDMHPVDGVRGGRVVLRGPRKSFY